MQTKEIQMYLRDIGWPVTIDNAMGPRTKEAIADFQHGYTFIELEVDGIAGPATRAALLDCVQNKDGRRPGMAAEFFAFSEFKSKGNGWIKVHPRLLNRLDALRRATGPVHIVSGYRDPDHNRRVGGASSSQHLYGTASDIGAVPVDIARDCGFSGIGIGDNGAVHVDVRAEGPNNTSGARVGAPTVWYY